MVLTCPLTCGDGRTYLLTFICLIMCVRLNTQTLTHNPRPSLRIDGQLTWKNSFLVKLSTHLHMHTTHTHKSNHFIDRSDRTNEKVILVHVNNCRTKRCFPDRKCTVMGHSTPSQKFSSQVFPIIGPIVLVNSVETNDHYSSSSWSLLTDRTNY